MSRSGQPFRIEKTSTGRSDQIVRFTFDGKAYEGYLGDTLASALLANAVHIVGRSFKYHRPRGIFSDDNTDPNAMVRLESRRWASPNTQATQIELYDGLVARSQNCWPNPRFDLMSIIGLFSAILPAGFYYKTFKWPRSFWKYYEHFIRHAAGLGRVPGVEDQDTYDRLTFYTDVLIIGAGPAGLKAAGTIAPSGCRVALVEQTPWLGGRCAIEEHTIADADPKDWCDEMAHGLRAQSNVTILRRTTAFGYYDQNLVYCLERVSDHSVPSQSKRNVRQRLWRIRAKQVIVATGATERPLLFNDNDRPGIMLAASVGAYINRHGVLPGLNSVIFTNNDSAYDIAQTVCRVGGSVVAILDSRKNVPEQSAAKAHSLGIEVMSSAAITEVHGRRRVKAISCRQRGADGTSLHGKTRRIGCDLLACSGGWNPVVHLFSQAGGELRFDSSLATVIPASDKPTICCVGAATGRFSLHECLNSGEAAGNKVLESLGYRLDGGPGNRLQVAAASSVPVGPLQSPHQVVSEQSRQFVDLQNDVTVADIGLAAREGYESVEHLKRYTTTGMGPDQGKTANINAIAVLAAEIGQTIENFKTTTFRPPYIPVTFGALAGYRRGDLVVPIRSTPIQDRHRKSRAIFENVGRWKRPIYYPQGNESAQQAAMREALNVREHVGIMEVSPFGKIELKGRDALTFINRLYTGSFDSLAIGRCRYGVMLNEDGSIHDDGLVIRLGEHHFLLSTTSGKAEAMPQRLEYWLQCRWPELELFLNDVSEQWAQIVVAGPRSRELLHRCIPDLNLDNDSFPHLSMSEATIGATTARVFRVSFTGDLAYEIAIPARHGCTVWDMLLGAGKDLQAAPYGLIASNILRMEKGYILVGEDTEGVQTPMDMGLSWLVSQDKTEDFIGKRSLSMQAIQCSGRKEFIGLLSDEPDRILTPGCPIVEPAHEASARRLIGHVTSSQYSVAMGRSIALGLLENGRSKIDQSVKLADENRLVTAKVVKPAFYDVNNENLNA